MVLATASGWGAVIVGAAGLGLSLVSLAIKAVFAAELRGFVDLLVAAQVRRAGRQLDLDDPEQAGEFLEEWNAELGALQERPLTRLRFALDLRRVSRELSRNSARDLPQVSDGKRP